MNPSIAKPNVIFLMGATASGKTDLAIKLTQQLPCDIISVDSTLIYKEMDIGTAKPDAETLALAPHKLINICDPADVYSVAKFRADALEAMHDISSKGRIPLLVGGTMLYFKILNEGIAELPSADHILRQKIEAEAEQIGWDAMHAKLVKIDPVAAQKIHPNNPQRLLRALEVYELTGIPLSVHWQKNKDQKNSFAYQVNNFAIASDDRPKLHQRINQRFEMMLKIGLIEEVEQLRSRGDLNQNMPSMKSVGYRQVWEYLNGAYSYDEMMQKGMAATRQLAKRQLTWLRSWENLHWLRGDTATQLNEVAIKMAHQINQ